MKPISRTILLRGWVFLAFLLVLAVNAAIPGITTPTLGQAVWTSSFAQSFANQHGLAIYARDFGLPQAVPIPFGLSGALPLGWLILLGAHPAEAYTLMVVLWLGVAFAGARALARSLGASEAMATALATVWLTLPIVWGHASYSMLSLGVALMPAYTWCTVVALRKGGMAWCISALASLVAAFMDGYTFVMYAFVSFSMLLFVVVNEGRMRWRSLGNAFALLVSVGVAAICYRAYAHSFRYEPPVLESFRGWGMDVTFALMPTEGLHLLWDFLGLAVERSGTMFYGDASTWVTTFCAPLLVLAAYAAFRVERKAALVLMALAASGFYLSLGPSLKIDSRRPVTDAQAWSPLMPADAAVAPTGSAALYMRMPGLRLMRAAYRWEVVGLLGCWLLVVMAIGQSKDRRLWGALLVACTLCVLPHPLARLREGIQNRAMLHSIGRDFVKPFRGVAGPVVFAPIGNDFLAAYAAARTRVPTYNVGGDKSLAIALSYWPASVRGLTGEAITSGSGEFLAPLAEGDARSVVLPYVDMLWAAHNWPCGNVYVEAEATDPIESPVSTACVAVAKSRVDAALAPLSSSPFVELFRRPYFAVVQARTKPFNRDEAAMVSSAYPVKAFNAASRMAFGPGWYPAEADKIWSTRKAHLSLPVPPDCQIDSCVAIVHFAPFSASAGHPVRVSWSSEGSDTAWRSEATFTTSMSASVSLPLQPGASLRHFVIEVPDATSPSALGTSTDGRVLGISVVRIDLVRGGPEHES